MSNAERLAVALEPIFGTDEVEVDSQLVDRMVAAASELTNDQTTIVMTGGGQFQGTYEGPEGMREAWSDWLETFSRVRFQIEGIEEVGENVLTFARQVGTTRHGGVEIEQPSAAVWKFRGDKIVRIEFHLNRDAARESARSPA
jgi:ketosteroid isomerase-like protein